MDEKRAWPERISVLLLVLVLHCLLVAVLIRARKLDLSPKPDSTQTLLVYFLPREATPGHDAVKAEDPSKFARRRDDLQKRRPSVDSPSATIIPPIEAVNPTPQIDWQHELELAVLNEAANEEAKKNYLNLARSMSPSQAGWLKEHQMEPASPGLTWKKPRVEITKDGMPIVHINDHCVLVPMLFVPMVFCSAGHIEPNGDLFKHMRDPQSH